MKTIDTTFIHRASGEKCTLIPNINWNKRSSHDTLYGIDYVELSTGLIKSSSIADAGIFIVPGMSESLAAFYMRDRMVEFGYVQAIEE